jgi:hypothetical protein
MITPTGRNNAKSAFRFFLPGSKKNRENFCLQAKKCDSTSTFAEEDLQEQQISGDAQKVEGPALHKANKIVLKPWVFFKLYFIRSTL